MCVQDEYGDSVMCVETVTATPLPTMPSLMRALRGPRGQEDIVGVHVDLGSDVG